MDHDEEFFAKQERIENAELIVRGRFMRDLTIIESHLDDAIVFGFQVQEDWRGGLMASAVLDKLTLPQKVEVVEHLLAFAGWLDEFAEPLVLIKQCQEKRNVLAHHIGGTQVDLDGELRAGTYYRWRKGNLARHAIDAEEWFPKLTHAKGEAMAIAVNLADPSRYPAADGDGAL